jgi:hypothetical protein
MLDCEMLISQEFWQLKSCKCKPAWYDYHFLVPREEVSKQANSPQALA